MPNSKFQIPNSKRGQVLAELLIAIAVMVIFASFGAQLVYVSLRSSESSKNRGAGLRLSQEAMEVIQAIAQGNDTTSQGWNRVYLPPNGSGDAATSKGANKPYYPIISTSTPSQWILFTGTETITLEGETYTRKVIIDNVSRDTNADIEATYNSANDDPATQKITVTVSKSDAPDTTIIEYVTRFLNDSGPQSDWSAAVNCGPVAATSSPTAACTTTSIITTNPVGSFKIQ